ncbi:MAG: hypothetical protein DRJ66_05210 [Thermoprotei archaeon]|nr:MAG: hypothetical protein DRJ66_05210 [Thermoprotei archaeon]RLF20854.1 MAG: hypothetical protein DRZ82_00850 [Thermoprotei archaeon]
MGERILSTPIELNEIIRVKVGDVLYVNGIIVTARDAAHKRIIRYCKEGKRLPLNLKGLVIMHAGPIVVHKEGQWVIKSIGPTSSYRMEPYMADVIKITGIRMIIGKGVMGRSTMEACRKYGAIYAIYPGGTAALATKCIVRVIDVKWLDLGIPEALWILEVRMFGPLFVAIDAKGNNFFERRLKRVENNLLTLQKELELIPDTCSISEIIEC